MRRALAGTLANLGAGRRWFDVRVASAQIDYAEVGFDQRNYSVRVIAGRADDETAEDLLDELTERDGDRSVKELLEADRTLGGLVADVAVARCTGAQIFRQDDHDAIGATWLVTTRV